jgi:hypothetical protein
MQQTLHLYGKVVGSGTLQGDCAKSINLFDWLGQFHQNSQKFQEHTSNAEDRSNKRFEAYLKF